MTRGLHTAAEADSCAWNTFEPISHASLGTLEGVHMHVHDGRAPALGVFDSQKRGWLLSGDCMLLCFALDPLPCMLCCRFHTLVCHCAPLTGAVYGCISYSCLQSMHTSTLGCGWQKRPCRAHCMTCNPAMPCLHGLSAAHTASPAQHGFFAQVKPFKLIFSLACCLRLLCTPFWLCGSASDLV